MKLSSTINLYKNKYSRELLNLIPKFFCKSTSRILINDMMESDVITRHRYCLPTIEEKSEISLILERILKISIHNHGLLLQSI